MEEDNHNREESESDEEMPRSEEESDDRRSDSGSDSSSENEVYCFYDSDGTYTHAYDSRSVSTALDTDLDDEDSFFDDRSWGRRSQRSYDIDCVDDDDSMDENDYEVREIEEAEARRIQRRIASELNETDFVIALRASERQTTENEKLEEVAQDVRTLSTRQKLELMQKESPEFFVLVQDLKSKLNEIDNVLIPILNYFGTTNDMPAPVKFLKKKFLVLTNYCTNITFYLLLKAKRSPVVNHPVLKSLYRYRRVMEEIQELDEAMRPKIEKVLMELKDNRNPALEKLVCALKKKNVQRLLERSKEEETMREVIGSDTLNAVGPSTATSEQPSASTSAGTSTATSEQPSASTSAGTSAATSEQPSASTSAGTSAGTSGIQLRKGSQSRRDAGRSGKPDKGKRAISYQMAKNRGLIPRRNKLQRNPRVKHRNKYKKALIKRRGQMRFARTEIPAYGGEPSGIKTNVTKSIKFK